MRSVAQQPRELPQASLRLTLLFVVLYGPSQPHIALPLALVACPMLVGREWLSSRLGWGLLAAIMVQHLALDRLNTDNHQFLAAYWILTINLALWSNGVREEVPQIAQSLIGLTFLFAVAWKLVLGESLDGNFWEGIFLADGRLRIAAAALGGIPLDALASNDLAQARLRDPLSDIASVRLISTPRLQDVGVAVGITGVLLESIVAVLYLAPRQLVPQAIRIGAIAFFLLVYGLLPIVGFGWILISLTLAHLEEGSFRESMALIAAAGVLVVVQPAIRVVMAIFVTS